jgi:predicted lipoprotein with Yx(FWY)xxD motif
MMMNMRSLTATCALMIAPITLAACGSSSTSSGSATTSTPSAVAAPSQAAAAPSPAATSAGTAVVATATATVGGVSKTILTDTSGKTLYYRTPDTATKAACTGGCAGAWPPLAGPSGTPTSSTPIPGTLAVINSGNGPQVTYNGHPLYRFGATPPGDTSGNGVGGIWFVATAGLT